MYKKMRNSFKSIGTFIFYKLLSMHIKWKWSEMHYQIFQWYPYDLMHLL